MSLPNKITILRLILTPIGLAILLIPSIPYNYLLGTIIFLFAMITDVLDGYIARKYNMITNFGIFADSLIDKLIILLHFIFLQSFGIYPLWLLLAFVGREMFMDGFKSFALRQGAVISAKRSGKNKALLQTISITIGLVYLSIEADQFFGLKIPYLEEISYYSMLLAFVISIYGAYSLIRPNLKIFSTNDQTS